MATPTIPNGETQFFPIIYEGSGGGQRVGRFVPFTDNATIDNSVIFNDGDSPKLAITPSSNGNRRTWTFSAWIKRGVFGQKAFFSWDNTAPGGGGGGDFRFDSSHRLQLVAGGATAMYLTSNRTFEDTSKYYHIYIKVDTTQSTASDRVEIYVDGDKITSFSTSTYPSQNKDFNINNTSYETRFGALNDNGSLISYFDGYLAEVNFVDGTNPAVSTFGVVDTSTNRWVPKTLSGINYGTNGFRLKFQDSSALGDDTSGNGNDLTATNLASTDQTTDSPTQNHCTWDSNDSANLASFSEGNLKVTGGSASTSGSCRGTLAPKSGKYYFEIKFLGGAFAGHNSLGIRNKNVAINSTTSGSGVTTESYHWRDDGFAINGTLGQMNSGFSSYTTNDYIGVAMDLDTGKVWMSKNGTYEKSGNPETGANPMFTVPTGQPYAPWWLGYGYTNNNELNCGQRAFNTSAPTGFVALQQDNLPETAKGISGLVWTKNRDSTDSHQLYDSSRGKQKVILPDATTAESTVTDGLQKFLAGGQQIEDNVAINTSGESYVSWNWVANGGSTSSNTDGSITSTTQVNSDAGFSIVEYTGNATAGATVGHGLSSKPNWIVVKSLGTGSWYNYHSSVGATKYALLNTTSAFASSALVWNNTEPTSSVFSLGSGDSNTNSANFIAYCWHEVEGFSKFGSYTGNGNADGTFVATNFSPSFVMIKSSSHTTSWYLFDNKRNPINPAGKRLVADGTFVEDAGTTEAFDFLSNGFKLRNSSAGTNGSGRTYIYMAFAKCPFANISPATAR